MKIKVRGCSLSAMIKEDGLHVVAGVITEDNCDYEVKLTIWVHNMFVYTGYFAGAVPVVVKWSEALKREWFNGHYEFEWDITIHD